MKELMVSRSPVGLDLSWKAEGYTLAANLVSKTQEMTVRVVGGFAQELELMYDSSVSLASLEALADGLRLSQITGFLLESVRAKGGVL